MTCAAPYFREAGTGPGVVCLHSNASSSAQWRSLMDSLATTHHVLAPDLYGSGKSPDWHSDSVIALADEAELIEPVLQLAGSPLTLVGHSHGAALALRIATQNPERVRALALYEPTLFSLIETDGLAPNEADGIRNAVLDAARALDAGDADVAARHFIDYWTGPGSWAATPEARRPAIAVSVRNVRRWAHALMTEPTPLAAFEALRVPVLLMTGERSTAAAHGVARRLAKVLPNVTCIEIAGLGHMGPITHAELVNAQIASFVRGQ
ncbi:MAG: alpha/beta hydrolase [Ramlibacter sp.]|nr:alpha/beta hydrolase [Ramlibacter sp.]